MPQHRETASAVPVQSSKCSKQRQTWTPSAPNWLSSPSAFHSAQATARRTASRRDVSPACLSHSAALQQACVRYHAVRGRLSAHLHLALGGSGAPEKNQDPKTSTPRREQITEGASKDHDASNGTHSGSLPCAVDCGALREVVQG